MSRERCQVRGTSNLRTPKSPGSPAAFRISLGFVDSRCGHVSPFVAPGARARPGRPWACGGADRGPADDSRTRIQMRSARIAPALLFVRAKARIGTVPPPRAIIIILEIPRRPSAVSPVRGKGDFEGRTRRRGLRTWTSRPPRPPRPRRPVRTTVRRARRVSCYGAAGSGERRRTRLSALGRVEIHHTR